MNTHRVLYINTPFEHEPGGDKNRSRFLWQILRESGTADLALVLPPSTLSRPQTPFEHFPPALTLPATKGSWWQSESVFHFSDADQRQFQDLLAKRNYDLIVSRFHSPAELCHIAARHRTSPGIILDLDMVSSRLVGLTWKQNPSLKNRWFLFERLKLQRFERQLLQNPWLFALSNPVEIEQLRATHGNPPAPGRLIELPNMMPPQKVSNDGPRQSVILFFGSMNSSANLDGFRYLMDQILPRIEKELKERNVRIHVAGKNPPPWFQERIRKSGTDRVRLVGAVDSMDAAIAASLFVLLPLRIASGTRTRILEAAAQERAVVTTPIGAEGIDVGEHAEIHADPDGIAASVRRFLASPAEADMQGQELAKRCRARYSQTRIARELRHEIEVFLQTRTEAAR